MGPGPGPGSTPGPLTLSTWSRFQCLSLSHTIAIIQWNAVTEADEPIRIIEGWITVTHTQWPPTSSVWASALCGALAAILDLRLNFANCFYLPMTTHSWVTSSCGFQTSPSPDHVTPDRKPVSKPCCCSQFVLCHDGSHVTFDPDLTQICQHTDFKLSNNNNNNNRVLLTITEVRPSAACLELSSL